MAVKEGDVPGIIEMIQNGSSYTEVAKKYRQQVGTIRDFCKERGIEYKYQRSPVSEEQAEHIREQIFNGATYVDLAKEYGMGIKVIKRLCKSIPEELRRDWDETVNSIKERLEHGAIYRKPA